MGIILHLVTCLACIQVMMSQPIQEDGSPLFEDYSVRLAKKDTFYPFKESLLSSLGFLENSRGSIKRNPSILSSDPSLVTSQKTSPVEITASHQVERFRCIRRQNSDETLHPGVHMRNIQLSGLLAPLNSTRGQVQLEVLELTAGILVQFAKHFILTHEGSQNQRKKAVDSTFIRFGRSSPAEGSFRPNTPKVSLEDPDTSLDSAKSPVPQRFIFNHNGCRISNSRELVRALMNDRNCIRALQKVKRENVNDTFIRFGKRSVPSEAESQIESRGV